MAIKNRAGSEPFSEPESRAVRDFVLDERPQMVLTYHSQASVVSGNNSGKSNELAMLYAQKASYRYLPKSDTNLVFQYDTTGAFEDWLHDKHNMPTMLIELSSSTKSDFSKNKPALWMVLETL